MVAMIAPLEKPMAIGALVRLWRALDASINQPGPGYGHVLPH